MTTFIFIMIFVLGLAIGSFINALTYRIENEMPISRGRSLCTKCKHQLAWYDNVPVLSYLLLRGKCRYCKRPISMQYPVVELIVGVTFVAFAVKALGPQVFVIPADAGIWATRLLDIPGVTAVLLVSLFFVAFCLILVALYDQRTTYVLSGYVYAGIGATLIYLLTTYTGTWEVGKVGMFLLPNVIAALVAMLPFAILYIASRGKWMGAGDIEIAALLGLLLGWPHFLVALYFAFIVGSIWGLAKIYLLKNAGLKSEMPFAPFLIAGTIFAFIFSEQLINLYVKIFLG